MATGPKSGPWVAGLQVNEGVNEISWTRADRDGKTLSSGSFKLEIVLTDH